MKKAAILLAFVVFTLLPAYCFSAEGKDEVNSMVNTEDNSLKRSMNSFLFSKLMAEHYVVLLKEMVTNEKGEEVKDKVNDPEYQKAKFQYQIAYTKVRVFNSVYTFLLQEKGRIFREDEEKLDKIWKDAYVAYTNFIISAQLALNSQNGYKGVYDLENTIALNDNISMEELLRITTANVLFPDVPLTLENSGASSVMTALTSGAITTSVAADLLGIMYTKYANLRNSKYGKLTAWIDKCAWNSWDAILTKTQINNQSLELAKATVNKLKGSKDGANSGNSGSGGNSGNGGGNNSTE